MTYFDKLLFRRVVPIHIPTCSIWMYLTSLLPGLNKIIFKIFANWTIKKWHSFLVLLRIFFPREAENFFIFSSWLENKIFFFNKIMWNLSILLASLLLQMLIIVSMDDKKVFQIKTVTVKEAYTDRRGLSINLHT